MASVNLTINEADAKMWLAAFLETEAAHGTFKTDSVSGRLKAELQCALATCECGKAEPSVVRPRA